MAGNVRNDSTRLLCRPLQMDSDGLLSRGLPVWYVTETLSGFPLVNSIASLSGGLIFHIRAWSHSIPKHLNSSAPFTLRVRVGFN